MPEYVVAKVGDIPDGMGKEVEAAGFSIALYNVGGKYYAMDNICPHRGGPLAASEVTDGKIMCPLHSWEFRVEDGQCTHMDDVKQECFPVLVEEGVIKVIVGE